MKRLLIGPTLVMAVHFAVAQLPDSTKLALKNMPDSARTRFLVTEAEKYQDQDPGYTEALVDVVLANPSAEGILRGQAHRLKGLALMYQNSFELSRKQFRQSLEVYETMPPSTQLKQSIAELMSDIGRNFTWQAQYDSGLSYFIASNRLSKELDDLAGQAMTLNAIGIIYGEYNKNYEQALKTFREGLSINRQLNDSLAMAKVMQNIGQVFNLTGANDSALYYLKQSNKISAQFNDTRSLAIGHNILGSVYYDLNQLDSSEYYFLQAIELDSDNRDTIGLVYDYHFLAKTLFRSGKTDQAERYAKSSLELTADVALMAEVTDLLTQITEERGDYRQALQYQKLFKQYNDSVYNSEQRRTLDELQTRYETEKKEQEIKLANAELEERERFQFFLMVIIIMIVLFSSTAFFLLRQRFHLKQDLLSQEIDNLRLQINALLGKEGGELEEVAIDDINTKLNSPLSEREFEILQMALGDRSNREIAEAVFVSVNTVKFHMRNIYHKLGVSNRKEAVQFIIKPG